MANSTKTSPSTHRPLLNLALGLVIVAGMFVLIAGTTYAYLSLTTNTASNVFDAPAVQLQLVENGQPVDSSTQAVVYGNDGKQVQVANPTGSSDAVVRVTFAPQVVSADSTDETTIYEFFAGGAISEPIDNTIELTTEEGTITLHFAADWSSNWLYKDGFFYYNRVLEAGYQTPLLLIGVTSTLAEDTNVEVVVSAESLQAYPDQATAVWGVSIS